MRTRVKICGITRWDDAKAAVDAGADALGFVFYEPSVRNISATEAAAICNKIPAFVSRVALFVDANAETVNTILQQVPIDVIQFHGTETNEFCNQFNRPFLKALQARSKEFLDHQVAAFPDANAFLLDTFVKGIAGGTGKTFDWQLFNQFSPQQSKILAGGLNPDNIQDAIKATRPYAVDVSGGVEQSPGIKDHKKISSFISQVRQADAE